MLNCYRLLILMCTPDRCVFHYESPHCIRVSESEVFGWNRIPNNTGSRSPIFCPTPDVQLDHFLHHTPKLGIPVEMVQLLLKLLLIQISCCAPRFAFILTAQFQCLCAKESEI